MHKIFTLDNANVKNMRILLRVDLNVPMKDGQILEEERIEKIIPTIRELLEKGAKVILCAHLGRPKGVDLTLTLLPVAKALEKKLNAHVIFVEQLKDASKRVADLSAGQVLMLENLRFDAGEESNSMEFAKQLAELADLYVNDGFSVSHRAHASVEAITHLLPSYAGRLMQQEIQALTHAFDHPKLPMMAIVGGSKVSTKLSVLKSLAAKVMYLIPAGGIANTFALAHRQQIGKSLCEPDMIDMVAEIEDIALKSGCTIIPPSDVVAVENLERDAKWRICSPQEISYKEMVVDFGPKTVMDIYQIAQLCRTFIWNGPLGVFEIPPFEQGSVSLAKKMACLTLEKGLFSVAGGGETMAVLNQAEVFDQFSYVSTAGGAFLEWIEGKSLPGVEALKRSTVITKQQSGQVVNGN